MIGRPSFCCRLQEMQRESQEVVGNLRDKVEADGRIRTAGLLFTKRRVIAPCIPNLILPNSIAICVLWPAVPILE